MRVPRSFASIAIALTLLGMSAPARAGIVLLNNLDQPALAASAHPFFGQSFIAGTVNEPLYGAKMALNSDHPPSSGITLEVEARNSDGTVGATLFSSFSESYDSTTNLVTFTAKSAFELTAGTGYWLVLSDSKAGGVAWNFTESYSYQSQYAYQLPSYDTAWISTGDNGTGTQKYYQPSDGPELFQLIAPSPVPEPPSLLLLVCSVAPVVVAMGFRRARAFLFKRYQAGA